MRSYSRSRSRSYNRSIKLDEAPSRSRSRSRSYSSSRSIQSSVSLSRCTSNIRLRDRSRSRSRSPDSNKLYPKYEKEKRRNHILRYWLKTRHSLSNTPKHLIQPCFDKIVQSVYGGLDKFVTDFVIRWANDKDLAKIHEIIKNVNLEYKRTKKQNEEQDNKTNTDCNNHKKIQHNNDNINYFDDLPNESISYIAGFLDWKEIKKLKLASSRIAVICLEEMMKFSVAIFNMNEIIDINFKDYYKNDVNFSDISYKYYRYHSNRTLHFLREEWKKYYNINEENQILFPIYPESQRRYNKHKADSLKIDERKFRNFEIKCRPNAKITELYYPRKYILFDKTNMVKIGAKNEIQPMFDGDRLDDDHQLIILKYFDIRNQCITPIQFIMIYKDITYNDIINYIQKRFVPRNEKQRQFHKAIQKDIKEMNVVSSNDDILSIYHMTKQNYSGKYRWSLMKSLQSKKPIYDMFKYNKCRTILFQLNPQHQWILNEWEKQSEFVDFVNFQNHLKSMVNIRVRSAVDIDTLSSQIKSFDIEANESMMDAFCSKTGKLYSINTEGYNVGKLLQEIAADIGNNNNKDKIDWKYLELYSKNNDRRHGVNYYRNTDKLKRINVTNLIFKIVSYDVTKTSNDENICNVKIYLPENGPFPFHNDGEVKEERLITIPFQKPFNVGQFIHYIMSNVILRKLYIDNFKDIYSFYSKNRENVRFILSEETLNIRSKERDYYLCNDEIKWKNDYHGRNVSNYDIFIMYYPSLCYNDNTINITIHFCLDGITMKRYNKFDKMYEDDCFIGLPLIISINKNDENINIKNIIENHEELNKYKESINLKEGVFKIRSSDDRIVEISINDYNIFDNDMFILKISLQSGFFWIHNNDIDIDSYRRKRVTSKKLISRLADSIL